MATTALITASEHEGKTYYTAVARGTEYCAFECAGQWFVSSRRLALGRSNVGGGRYYATLADVAAGCKALAGLDLLLSV
jgi:hypothetical protein